MKVRKKPVVVDAEQYTGDNFADIKAWAGPTVTMSETPTGIIVETLEGTMRAEPGCWIIRGVKGEFYPCQNDIFAETYDVL